MSTSGFQLMPYNNSGQNRGLGETSMEMTNESSSPISYCGETLGKISSQWKGVCKEHNSEWNPAHFQFRSRLECNPLLHWTILGAWIFCFGSMLYCGTYYWKTVKTKTKTNSIDPIFNLVSFFFAWSCLILCIVLLS